MSAEPWVRIGDGERSSADVRDAGLRAATGFAALGVGSGDVVVVYLRNDFPLIEAAVGAGALGAYTTPANWHSSADEAGYLFENSGAKAIVIHADLLRKVEAALPEGVPVLVVETPEALRQAYGIGEADARIPEGRTDWSAWLAALDPREAPPAASPGAMIYTSGTTGRPKGVRRQIAREEQLEGLANMVQVVGGTAEWVGRESEMVCLIAAPGYHSSPNGWINNYFNMGANLVLAPKFEPEAILAAIEQYRVTHLHAVPTMFVRLLALPDAVKRRYDVSSLRFVMHVGAPCPVHVKRAMIDWWGPVINEHYGSTEVGAVTACTAEEWLAHPGTVGKALPGAELLVVNDAGEIVGPGSAGEILCRANFYPDFTYHGDDEKRRRAEKLGLISIGDVGYLDADGFLYLSGRANDMIIFGGSNIYPAEIEAELLKIDGVADCAVFGIPDAEFGEQVCAHVQMQPGRTASAEAIRVELRERLASYKVPRVVVFDETLPREDTGKIFKRKLREPYWEGHDRRI